MPHSYCRHGVDVENRHCEECWPTGGGINVEEDQKPTDADRLRELIAQTGLTQRGAARELGLPDRSIRAYCAGETVPRYVILAMERLAQIKGSP